jgi:hypothetical protein
MLAADLAVAQVTGLFLRDHYHLARGGTEAFEHE